MSTAVVPLRAGGRVTAIIPQTIEEVFRLAKAISASGLAPKGMTSPEQITVAIMHGAEIGLPPMQAVQKIAVVNGRPTVWGDALPALLWANGFRLDEWMDDAGTAHCKVTRPDGVSIVRTFSDADAKRAGLLGKPGPWQQFPNRMKSMRARGFACRDGAPDVLSGLYLREELDDGADEPRPLKAAPLPIPDIPDEPAMPAPDQAAVLRQIERRLDAEPHRALEIEAEFSARIMAMDDDGREAAVDMVQAAKRQPIAAK